MQKRADQDFEEKKINSTLFLTTMNNIIANLSYLLIYLLNITLQL